MNDLCSKIWRIALSARNVALGVDRSTLIKVGVVCLCGGAQVAFATTGGSGLPWETPLQTLSSSISGPVAGSVATAGVVGAGCMMMFGSEMNHMVKTTLNITCAAAVALGGAKMISTLFSTTGSLIF